MAAVYYHEGQFPPDKRLDWHRLVPLLGPAYSVVARYDGMLSAVPNPRILLAPLSTQEAVLSSRIEGTQATMGQVLEFEARGEARSPARRDDILEIIQYRRAMWHAEKMLSKLPLSQRVIRESHRVLLSGGRGRQRSPGKYRHIPNWIGPPGCSIEDAKFVTSWGGEAARRHERLGTVHAPGRTRPASPTRHPTRPFRSRATMTGPGGASSS